VSDKVRKEVSRFARPAIWGALAGSAAMNAFAFAAQADGYTMMAAAVTLGVAIPALIYALTRVGVGLWIAGGSPTATRERSEPRAGDGAAYGPPLFRSSPL
jgi:hypothetical protein